MLEIHNTNLLLLVSINIVIGSPVVSSVSLGSFGKIC